ncbi:exocyst complex component exo70 [Blastocladiella emersonii ATCC 22665]|nr:exocyst complex component exo70 [Blastocladiella emersonii ATCC 22665]
MSTVAPVAPPRGRNEAAMERRRENERKLMEDMADVEVLEDTLARSLQISTQMIDMLTSFDDRLKSFEKSMLPIHRSTQRLNQYYENIDQTLSAANRVIQYYDLAEQERETIAKDPDESNLLPYLESLDRITNALKFLTESRFASGEKAIYKLRQQQNAGIMQLVNLFKKWLIAISSPLDFMELIRSGRTEAPTPPPADVKRISELATWLANTAASGAAPATPAAAAADPNSDMADYAHVYTAVRGSYMQRSLAPPASASGESRSRIETKASAIFVQRTQWLARFLGVERALVEAMFFHPRKRSEVLDAAAGPAVSAFLAAGESLLAQMTRSNGRSDTSHVFVLFDVLEFWSAKRDELGAVFDMLVEKGGAIEALFDSWTKAALRIVPDFLDEVKQSGKGQLPPDGTVHEVTSNAISLMKKLLEYPDSTESILLSIGEPDWGSTNIKVGNIKYVKSSGVLTRKYFTMVLGLLESSLDAKAKLYKKPALSIIFQVNNSHYILKGVRSEKLAALLGADAVSKYERTVKRHRDALQDQFKPLLEQLMDVTVIQGGAIRRDMSSSERTGVKDKFSKFNTSIEDIVKSLRVCAVPDPELRAVLIKDAKNFVVPMYERFVNKYQTSDFSKHKEKYIKFDVTQVERMLDGLFMNA